jgi:hypothetical protein
MVQCGKCSLLHNEGLFFKTWERGSIRPRGRIKDLMQAARHFKDLQTGPGRATIATATDDGLGLTGAEPYS